MSESKNTSSEIEEYDFLVLGGGGSGLSGAMYAGRLGLKSLVLGHASGSELPVGGVITTTDLVENYPGFKSLTGHELAKKLEDHARDYEEVTIKSEKAEEVSKIKKGFSVKTKKQTYHAKTILVATGTEWKKLPESIKGSREFENKGINYCALCDAPLYKNKVVGLVGGSDSAAKDALVLSKHAKKVYIIYRGEEIHPEPINKERVEKTDNIEVINNTNITEIQGDKTVNQVILDNEYEGSKTLKLEGVFVAIGHNVLSGLAKDLGVEVNEKDEVKIDHATSETNIEGVFAAGDVTDKQFKQLITGVADACTSAHTAYEYIENKSVEV